MMYPIENPMNTAMQGMNQAANTYGRMQKEIEPPGPTGGGAMMSGMSGAVVGAKLGGMTGATAAAGETAAATGALGLGLGAFTGIGAAVGLASYLFS